MLRSRNRRKLVGGSPVRVLVLSEAGAGVLERALDGAIVDDPAASALLGRLSRYGVMHPAATRAAPVAVTTVIPMRDGGDRIAELVRSARLAGEVIVVDDGSTDGSPEVARAAGARVVRNAGRRGPAGARNTGLRIARDALVAFVDSDCTLSSHWAALLAGFLADGVAVAAPRVRSMPGRSLLARYEQQFSPLDMGRHPALIATRRGAIPYVPSAALLARRSVLLEFGGFDEDLRYGEDVDLVNRLVAHGHSVRYAPEVVVYHDPRATWGALARQRFSYGRSAPDLEARHPGAGGRLELPQARSLVTLAEPLGVELTVRVGARMFAGTGTNIARLVWREWLPLTLIGCVFSGICRRATLGSLAVMLCCTKRRLLLPRLLDNVAYAAGLWCGMVRRRSLLAVVPRRSR